MSAAFEATVSGHVTAVWAARDEIGLANIELIGRAVAAVGSGRLPTSVSLGERMGVDKAAAGRAVDFLVRFGLVREQSPHGYQLVVSGKVARAIAVRLLDA